jgi:crotonobetainyl-CoA:carnitine CoA-transferase CaiB-like acyl-CoA transferase
MAGALQGLKIIDLSRVLAGPWCSQILADLGAEVIKIERPTTGDDTRRWGPPWMPDQTGQASGESGYFQATNRNKYSVAVDISSPQGQQILHRLLKDADVLIENFKVGGLAKYQLDYASLSALYPRLIYCSISGFGQTGPRAEQPGYDFMIQGLSGLMSITGAAEGEPQKVGVAVSDIQTGLYAVIAIQAALWARLNTGRGQQIDLALFDVQLAALANQSMNFLYSGQSPSRLGNAHPNIVPYQVFKAQDQDFIVACGNDQQYRALCKAISRQDLATDRRFLRNQDRVKHRQDLVRILSEHFAQQKAAIWLQRILAAKVPVGLVNTIGQALADPQVQARAMLVSIPHPNNAQFCMLGSPLKLSDSPVKYRRAPPCLGQDTRQILATCYTESELEQLAEAGVIAV